MYPSASEILTAFTKNPDEGGKLLFERYYKPLVLFADSFLTDIHFSEDIVQDVFYDFIKHRSYRQIAPEALTTYLFRCIRNTCLNRLRNRKLVMEAELLKFEAAEEEAMTISPELIAAIRETIKQLPDKTRQVIVFYPDSGEKIQRNSRRIKCFCQYSENSTQLRRKAITETIPRYTPANILLYRKRLPDTITFQFFEK